MATATENPLLAAALRYAERGWLVFPCSGKTPKTTNGLKDATSTDTGLIEGWWNSWPDANVAIVTGTASGIVVLDIDVGGEDGYETLRALEAEHGELQPTASVKTPSGGSHLYHRHPGIDIRNSVRQLGPGLDIRGDGGYVVAPPSPGYVVDEEAPVAALPAWILETAARKQSKLADPVGEVIADGSRNATLASLAGSMRRRGASKAEEILAAIEVANRERCKPPLPVEEIQKIAASISRYAPAEAPTSSAAPKTPSEYRVTFTEAKPPRLVHREIADERGPRSGPCRACGRVSSYPGSIPPIRSPAPGTRGYAALRATSS